MVKKKKKEQKKLKNSSVFNKKKLKNAILSIMYEEPGKVVNYKQISSHLGIKTTEGRRLVSLSLEELKDDNYLEQISRGSYRLKVKTGTVTGFVELQPQGFAHVVSEGLDRPVLISSHNLNHAMDGDKVLVHLFARRKKHIYEGEVTEIVERAKSTFVGTVEMSRHFAFLIPSGKVGFDIFIAKENLNDVKNGQKAIAEIIEWPKKARSPFGKIIEVLGDAGNNETEMHAILAEFELPHKYPEKIEKAAEKISVEVPDEEYKKRRDFRKVPTFTIDPDNAKDFDDALSFRKLENGNWETGIHIADVTHYISPNSLIETEARDRATSVYLVDRVVPMLPERISNFVCSLRPGEDKLCFSAVFEMNDNADIVKQWFGETVINSDRRFSYEEAQEIIESGEGEFSREITGLNTLAQKLRSRRFNNGSIDFDRIEVKFDIDEDGKPLSVHFSKSTDANHLIEEFMLLANKRVAELIGKPGRGKNPKTFVYRIHDKPDPEKLQLFNSFISRFGYDIQFHTPKAVSSSMNKLLNHVKGKNEQNLVETLAIRTMAKAVYSTRNIGHYGLAFEYYTHFTSPIRRYPDMMAHRLLKRYLQGGRSVNTEKYEELCRHSSDMENRAADAERASIKYKQVEFMQNHIGEIYPGVISGVTGWGIYVELENKIEGMIPIAELNDDFYIFDEKNYALNGRHYNKKYQLGDKITVQIWRTNLEKKQLDFRPANNPDSQK